MSRSNLRREAVVFSALGDETRLILVQKLGTMSEQSIRDLSTGLPISRQAVSKHLAVLEEAGLVSRIQKGRETHYKTHTKPLRAAQKVLAAVEKNWDHRLARLKIYAENTKESQ